MNVNCAIKIKKASLNWKTIEFCGAKTQKCVRTLSLVISYVLICCRIIQHERGREGICYFVSVSRLNCVWISSLKILRSNSKAFLNFSWFIQIFWTTNVIYVISNNIVRKCNIHYHLKQDTKETILLVAIVAITTSILRFYFT